MLRTLITRLAYHRQHYRGQISTHELTPSEDFLCHTNINTSGGQPLLGSRGKKSAANSFRSIAHLIYHRATSLRDTKKERGLPRNNVISTPYREYRRNQNNWTLR